MAKKKYRVVDLFSGWKDEGKKEDNIMYALSIIRMEH